MKTVFPSKKFWNQFANRFEIYKSMVPLFKRSKNLIVETKLYGQNDRKILKRSDEMEEFGPTRLTFLEYLLIGVASNTFGKELLNEERVNR